MISNGRTVAFICILGVIGLFMLSDTLSGMRNPGSALAERIPTVPSQTSLYMLANQMQVEKNSIWISALLMYNQVFGNDSSPGGLSFHILHEHLKPEHGSLYRLMCSQAGYKPGIRDRGIPLFQNVL